MAKVGLSRIYFAKYQGDGLSSVTYSDGILAARAVRHQFTPQANSSNNDLYGDNGKAESASGMTSGGDITTEVTELSDEAAKFLYNLQERKLTVDGAEVTEYVESEGNISTIVGYGFIEKHIIRGVTKYKGVVFTKVQYNVASDDIQTQGETISWQTTSITGTAMRDDSATHDWRRKSQFFETEAKADKYLRTVLNITDAVIDTLTVTSNAGSSAGKTEITVTPALIAGRTYRYKTGATVAMPALYDDLYAWTPWNGTAEITANDGDTIVIAEVDSGNQAMAAGSAIVVAAD